MVDRLAWYQARAREVRMWRWILFWAGLFFSTIGAVAVSAFQHSPGERLQAVPAGGLTGSGTFWFGIALVAISELWAINQAIRETHLEEAGR